MPDTQTRQATAIEVLGPPAPDILTSQALAFLAGLHRRFNGRRLELLTARDNRRARIAAGDRPGFLAGTAHVRESGWTIAPVPAALQDRRVEITGPADRKMMINALNSGARIFMADFEDSLAPTWENVTAGQRNVYDASRNQLEFTDDRGRIYAVLSDPAILMIRPRGWHLEERHLLIDGEPISASLFDFGLAFFHNARAFLNLGGGPYFYLPKLESHLEARLWNEVFVAAQQELDLPLGTIKATVLIETVLAAFEMDEILYELRDHIAGLNAGRWDYIFSVIKTFGDDPAFVLPDRAQVTMTAPFMRAYTRLLVYTCHRRGAHAIGGMSAFIPSRREPEINQRAMAGVREDKEREADEGFDGTWVAHPDLVPLATSIFDEALGDGLHQKHRLRKDVHVTAAQLLDTAIPGGAVSEDSIRTNVRVGLQYLEAWLSGIGAVAINNLMEDAATAEISRSQLWQWVRHAIRTSGGTLVTADAVRAVVAQELTRIREALGPDVFNAGRWDAARSLFEEVSLADDFVDFLTLPAYARLT